MILIILVNIVILLFSIVTVLSVDIGFWSGIIVVVIAMIGINLWLLISYALTRLLESTLIKRIEKNREENFSLYDWLGKTDINIYQKLVAQKGIESKDLVGNYNKIVEIIKDEFTNRDELNKLKLILEVIQESPRTQLVKNSVQTLLLASLTPAVLQIINIFLNNEKINEIVFFSSIGIFLLLWILLLSFIEFISKTSDRISFLLKIVENQLKHDSFYKK